MDDPRWLRLITIGLVLAALAVGYFLLTGKLAPKSANKTISQNTPAVSPIITPSSSLGQSTPSPSSTSLPSASPIATTSAYGRIVSRTENDLQNLPKTGFPFGLGVALAVSTLISGWYIRKFPN